MSGDGYNDNPFVHTRYELFEGLTVLQATEVCALFCPLGVKVMRDVG